MILVDTSVWVDHFRRGNKRLTTLLLNDQVLTHPFVIGELACGNLKNRKEILGLLQKLPLAVMASHQEVLTCLEYENLFGKGLGYVDVHLLASCRLSNAKLWSLDKMLNKCLALTQPNC